MICNDCPRLCGVDRTSARGYCGGGEKAAVAKVIADFDYEEPCLGRVTAVFFGGCSLKCSYCQNYEISRKAIGTEYSDGELATLFRSAKHPLDLVTPTHYISAIERAVALCKTPPIIYNTSGYETADGIKRAAQFIDVFLTDVKYADGTLASKYSSAPDYFERAAEAIKIMRNTPDEWEQAGDSNRLKRGLIVRHLVLPGHVENSVKVLDFIANELGTDTIVSLMSQFTPNGVGEPSARLKKIEYKIVAEHALKLGFRNGYFQDFDSANSAYTPKFI